MNSYLRPLVKELNMLWTDGFEMKKGARSFRIFAVLLATVCDIPGTQKRCGFVGHASHLCCCKCKKNFPYNKELSRVNFSGADLGVPRNHDEQKRNAKMLLQPRLKQNEPDLNYNMAVDSLNLCICHTMIVSNGQLLIPCTIFFSALHPTNPMD